MSQSDAPNPAPRQSLILSALDKAVKTVLEGGPSASQPTGVVFGPAGASSSSSGLPPPSMGPALSSVSPQSLVSSLLKRFPCTHAECTKTYDTEHTLGVHRRGAHSESCSVQTVLGTLTSVRGPNGKLPCPVHTVAAGFVCDKSYTTTQNIRTHAKSCAQLVASARAGTQPPGFEPLADAAGPSHKPEPDRSLGALPSPSPSPSIQSPPSASDPFATSAVKQFSPPSHVLGQPLAGLGMGSSRTTAAANVANGPTPASRLGLAAQPPPLAPLRHSAIGPSDQIALEIGSLKRALAAANSYLERDRSEHLKETRSLRQQVGELTNERDALIVERDAKAATYLDFQKDFKSSKQLEADLAGAVAVKHAAEMDLLESNRRALEDENARLRARSASASVQPGEGDPVKEVEKLKKKLALSAREVGTLREELAAQKRANESAALFYKAKTKETEQKDKMIAQEIASSKQAAKEARENEVMLRTSEVALRTTLATRDDDVKTLKDQLERLTAAHAALKDKIAASSSSDRVASTSSDRPAKRPSPADASSSSQRPAKKPAPSGPDWTSGMPTTSAAQNDFKRHWMKELVPRRPEGRICSLCPGNEKERLIQLSTKELASDATIMKAVVAHLASQHGERWDRICAGETT